MESWLPSREEGLRRLNAFLPRAGRAYSRLRNYDLGRGEHEHVSALSPWIRHRLVLEEEVVRAVLAQHRFTAAEKFIQEVFWRTYWKGWLELRPQVWSAYRQGLRRRLDEVDGSSDLRSRWEVAMAGRTGIDCFDAWSQELVETGYLHNHARMWFASIWIFTLELPWELGADFFLRNLLDGDPASNTLSWRWVGGLQTRGKTYLARSDNIARYTEGRFHPQQQLAGKALPLKGDAPPAPIAPPRSDAWDPALPTGLLLTEEDLHPEFLLAENSAFRGLAVLCASERRSPLDVSPLVLDFVGGAVDDALEHLRGKGLEVAGPDPDADPVGEIVGWAKTMGLCQIVTPYIPVGPTAEQASMLREKLDDHGIRLVFVLRVWDRLSWPHATRGFFPFREKIPAILARLENADVSPA